VSDLGERDLPLQHGAYLVQAQPELAQGTDQFQPSDRSEVVEPVPAGAAASYRYRADVRPVADGVYRKAGAARQLPDSQQPAAVVVHAIECETSSQWRFNPALKPLRSGAPPTRRPTPPYAMTELLPSISRRVGTGEGAKW